MQVETLSKRLDYMDVFRGFGIILMVMGHVGFGGRFNFFIHAFHMPMFFFVSGYFYRNKNYEVKEYIAKKAKTLLIPYISFGIAHYIVFLLIYKDFTIEPLLNLLILNTHDLPIAGALWFLTALFFTDILYFILDKHHAKWIILPLVLIGSYADQYLPYPLPWAMSASFVGLGLYYLGNFIRKNEARFKILLNMNWPLILLLGLITTVLIFTNEYINMRDGIYAIVPLFWVNALLSILVGISVSKKVCLIGAPDWLIDIGKNSIVYVCMNQIVILAISNVIHYMNLPQYVSKIIILLAAFILLHLCCLLFTKTKLRFFIGKGK